MLNLLRFFRSVVVLLATFALVSTVFGFLGQYDWVLDLFAHFRVQYLVILAVAFLVFLLLNRRVYALVCLIFAGINLYVLMPYLWPHEAAQNNKVSKGIELRAAHFNVNAQSGHPLKVANEVTRLNPDILVLEEITPIWVNSLSHVLNDYPYQHVKPEWNNFGIGIFSKFPFAKLGEGERVKKTLYLAEPVFNVNQPLSTKPSTEATLQANVLIEDKILNVVAVHPFPPLGSSGSARRNMALSQFHRLVSQYPTIILGDFNATPWSYHFQSMLEKTGLSDSLMGHGIQATWPVGNALLRIPIDHFLYSSENIKILNRELGNDVGSDHYPLVVDFLLLND